MAKGKSRKLEPWEIGEVRILTANGLSQREIAEELGIPANCITAVYVAERDALASLPDTGFRLYALRRSLEHRRNRADRELRKFYQSLPKTVSGNGHKESHQWQIGRAIQLERELSQIDGLILRVDQQIAEHEARSSGATHAVPILDLRINPDERGDYPSRHGEVRDDGGDGDDGSDLD